MAEPVDPSKKHFYISIVKSLVRIVAGVELCFGNFVVAGAQIGRASCRERV